MIFITNLADIMEPVHYLILCGVTSDPGVDIRDHVKTYGAEQVIPGSHGRAGGEADQHQEAQQLELTRID